MIRVHRIPYSTNVERVALAAGAKGVEVEWIDHDPAERDALRELSGQELVPVAEFEGEVIFDSMRIVERLEALAPEPPLYPPEPSQRAQVDVFVEWFNFVWKRPPNELDEELQKDEPDPGVIEALIGRTRGWMPRFEAMLSGVPFLGGEALGAADVCAFPFLKYAALEAPPDDAETFHQALERCLKPAAAYPLLCEWAARVDALRRA